MKLKDMYNGVFSGTNNNENEGSAQKKSATPVGSKGNSIMPDDPPVTDDDFSMFPEGDDDAYYLNGGKQYDWADITNENNELAAEDDEANQDAYDEMAQQNVANMNAGVEEDESTILSDEDLRKEYDSISSYMDSEMDFDTFINGYRNNTFTQEDVDMLNAAVGKRNQEIDQENLKLFPYIKDYLLEGTTEEQYLELLKTPEGRKVVDAARDMYLEDWQKKNDESDRQRKESLEAANPDFSQLMSGVKDEDLEATYNALVGKGLLIPETLPLETFKDRMRNDISFNKMWVDRYNDNFADNGKRVEYTPKRLDKDNPNDITWVPGDIVNVIDKTDDGITYYNPRTGVIRTVKGDVTRESTYKGWVMKYLGDLNTIYQQSGAEGLKQYIDTHLADMPGTDLKSYTEEDHQKLVDVLYAVFYDEYLKRNPDVLINNTLSEDRFSDDTLNKDLEQYRQEEKDINNLPQSERYAAQSGMMGTFNQAISIDQAIESTEYFIHSAKNIMSDVKKEQESGSGFWAGVKGAGLGVYSAVRGWGESKFGSEDLVGIANVYEACMAYDAGKSNRFEDRLIDSYMLYCQAQAYSNGRLGYSYKSTNIAAESIPFMIEFLYSPGKKVTEKVVTGLTKRLIARFGDDAVKKAAEKLTNKEAKHIVMKFLEKKVGSTATRVIMGAEKGVEHMTAAAVMNSTTGTFFNSKDAVGRKLGTPEAKIVVDPINKEYSLKYSGTRKEAEDSWLTATGKAWTAGYIERLSEFQGEWFEPLIKGTFKFAGKMIPKKMQDAFGLTSVQKLYKEMKAADISKAFEEFKKKTSLQSPVGEFAEEILGGIENAFFVHDQKLDDNPDNGVFDKRSMIETALGVSVIPVLTNTVNVAAYSTQTRLAKFDLKKEMGKADAVGKETFGDRWADIKANIDGASEDPKQLSSILAGMLRENSDGSKRSREQQRVIWNYAKAQQRFMAASSMEQSHFESGEADPAQADITAAYDAGYQLQGVSRTQAKVQVDVKAEEAASTLGVAEDELDQTIGLNDDASNAVQVVKNVAADETKTEEEKQATIEYVSARAAYQGVVDNVNDDIESKTAAMEAKVDGNTNQDNGMVVAATMNDSSAVYIVGGSIATTEDGTVISSDGDGAIVVKDAVTGEMRIADTSDIEKVTESRMADEVKTENANRIRMEAAQAAAAEIEGTLPMQVGDVYNMANAQGQQVQVQVQADLGNGNYQVLINGTRANVTAETLQQWNDGYMRQQALMFNNRMKEKQTQQSQGGQKTASQRLAERYQKKNPQAVPVVEEEQEEQIPTALEQVPVDENGQRQYEQAHPSITYDALVEQAGEEMAMQVAGIEADKAAKEVEELSKAVPKGETTDEVIENAAKIANARAVAQAKQAYWEAVKNIPRIREAGRQMAAAAAQTQAQPMTAGENSASTQQAGGVQPNTAAQGAGGNATQSGAVVQPMTADDMVQIPDANTGFEVFNNLAARVKSVQGEEKAQILQQMSELIRNFAESLGVKPVIVKTREELLQQPCLKSKEAQREAKFAWDHGYLSPGMAYNGKLYILVEDCVAQNGNTAIGNLVNLITHEEVHNDNYKNSQTVDLVAAAIRNGEISVEDIYDVIRLVGQPDVYRQNAETMKANGEDPADMLADEALAHGVQAMTHLNTNLVTPNKILQQLINRAYEQRNRNSSGRGNSQQRSQNNVVNTSVNVRNSYGAEEAGQQPVDDAGNYEGRGRVTADTIDTEGSSPVADEASGDLERVSESESQGRTIVQKTGGEMGDDKHSVPTRFSVGATMQGAGFKATDEDNNPLTDEEGNVIITLGDKVFDGNHPVTVDDLKNAPNSIFNWMVADALAIKSITQDKVDTLYEKYASVINAFLHKGLAENGGIENLQSNWQWLGETVYKTVATNGDAQYSTSIDITRVCKKNEAVINSISSMQRKLGYGITPGQVMDIYLTTQQEGYQVPCPVCYVFSRYIRNGKYATAAINGMQKYGDHLKGGKDPWTVEQWEAELQRLEEINDRPEIKNALAKANRDVTTILEQIDKLGMIIMSKKATVDEKTEAKAKIEELDQRYKAAINVISQQSLTNWIKSFAIHPVQNQNELYPESWKKFSMRDFKNNALDLRLTANTMVKYPAIQRLRKSGGAAAGKEITFVANNELGSIVLIGSAKPETAVNNYLLAQQAETAKERNYYLKEARKDFLKAHIYAQQQSLRGGQRMWSWSDNIERLAPDVAMNLMQLELIGGALQSYSKQLEGIELVASMGGYVNGSLMGRGIGYAEVGEGEYEERDGKLYTTQPITREDKNRARDGRSTTVVDAEAGSPVYTAKDGRHYVLIFDDVVGIQCFGEETVDGHRKGLFELNQELDKAGNILVGMNDMHVRTAMADSRVYFIIPWHASGQSQHILAQMLEYLNVNLEDFNPQDFTNVQEEKNAVTTKDGVVQPINPYLIELWKQTEQNVAGKYKCGIKGGIPSGDGQKLSKQQKHYKELRDAIFDGNVSQQQMKEIMADEFLSQVYRKVNSFVDTGKMTNGDKKYIYPYEYWDENSTFDTADVNGERYLEYCRRLGKKPKFCGKLDGNEAKDFGNFAHDEGYWKLLIDRRMYDVNGNFQDLDVVDSEGFRPELVDPEETSKKYIVTKVADDEGTQRIVNKTIAKEKKRPGGLATVDYDTDLETAAGVYDDVRSRFSFGRPETKEEKQTKSENFKKWFGDWEKNPNTASKVVDENGEPLVMSHNTDNEFWSFDKERIGTGQGQAFLGRGFNFSRGGSSVYGKNEMQVYLDIKHPMTSNKVTISRNQLRNIITELDKRSTERIEQSWGSMNDCLNALLDYAEGDLDLYATIGMEFYGDAKDVIDVFQKHGFDGTIEYDRDGRVRNAVVFEPTQIKSATDNNGNFDGRNSDIRFSYGVPYQASKNKIAPEIIGVLPEGERFVDLFSGGGAMTHAAIESGKYGTYHMNDIFPIGQNLFLHAVEGKYNDYNRKVTKEEFDGMRYTEEGILHSYNGNGRSYAPDKNGRSKAEEQTKRVKALYALNGERDNITSSEDDYRNVEIRPGDVVYADIPYADTDNVAYKASDFDHKAFYEWAQSQDFPVYISIGQQKSKGGVKVPEGFTEIWSKDVKNGSSVKEEKVIVADKFAKGARFSYGVAQSDPFYSNAAKAVEGIKQEKASGEQWLAMIRKAGGLKAEEDKWMGLSEWLKAQPKSVTKADVMQFIADNAVKVEEVKYTEGWSTEEGWDKHVRETITDGKDIDELQEEVDELKESSAMYDEIGSDPIGVKVDNWLTEQMVNIYGDDFKLAYDIVDGQLFSNYDPWADDSEYTGVANSNGEYPANTTRLGYTTNGLANKREIALTVPTIEPYNESDNVHFGDAGNGRAVAWLRFGDATTKVGAGKNTETSIVDELEAKYHTTNPAVMTPADAARKYYANFLARGERGDHDWNLQCIQMDMGEKAGETAKEYVKIVNASNGAVQKVLVIDEIQSKRHQDGRENGYGISRKDAIREVAEGIGRTEQYVEDNACDVANMLEYNIEKLKDKERGLELIKALRDTEGSYVPDAPFRKNWHELAMKRALRYAAEHGYDKVAWTTGQQQSDRYNLSNVLDKVTKESFDSDEEQTMFALDFTNEKQEFITVDNASGRITRGIGEGSTLADLVGKDVAEKMMALPEDKPSSVGKWETGSEGMKGFYDKMLPSFMDKYGKKWGVKTHDVELDLPNKADRVMHAVDVTPEMRESVMEGQTMFSYGVAEKPFDESKVAPRKDEVKTSKWGIVKFGSLYKGLTGSDQLPYCKVWFSPIEEGSEPYVNLDTVLTPIVYAHIPKDCFKMDGDDILSVDMRKADEYIRPYVIDGVKAAIGKYGNRRWSYGVAEQPKSAVGSKVTWDGDAVNEFMDDSEKTFEAMAVTYPGKRSWMLKNFQNLQDWVFSEMRKLEANQHSTEWLVETRDALEKENKRKERAEKSAVTKAKKNLSYGWELLARDEYNNAFWNAMLVYCNNFVIGKINKALEGREVAVSEKRDLMHELDVNNRRSYTIHDLRDWFDKYNTDPEKKELFDMIMPTLEKMADGITVKWKNPKNPNWIGMYSSVNMELLLRPAYFSEVSDPQQLCKTILHEAIHAVTSYATFIYDLQVSPKHSYYQNANINYAKKEMPEGLKNAVEDLYNAYNQLKGKKGIAGKYGAESLDEMIAELANPMFREELKKQSLWEKVVDGITRILAYLSGNEGVEVNAYEALKNNLQRFLDNYDGQSVYRANQINAYNPNVYQGQYGDTASSVEPYEMSTLNAANEMVDQLNLGERAVVHTDAETLPEGANAGDKGWYDPRTGKIHINVGNCSDVNDVKKTVLHEAVAHFGLRNIMGQEQLDKFLKDLYMSNADVRAEVNKTIAKYGYDYLRATEEYCARLAETEVPQGVWNTVKAMFKQALRGAGFNVRLGDNDILYLLWKSKNALNDGDFFDRARDIDKQMELGTGNYARSGMPISNDAARNEYEQRAASTLLHNIEAVQDRMISLKAAQDAIAKETGKAIANNEDAYMAENRSHGSSKNEIEYFDRNYYRPLLKAVSDLQKQFKKSGMKVTQKTITDYMMAKHGIERNSFWAFRTKLQEMATQEEEQALMNGANAKDAKAQGKALFDRLYNQFKNDPSLRYFQDQYNTGQIDFAYFEQSKRSIMETYAPGTQQEIIDQGDKSGLKQITDEDTDFEQAAFDMVNNIERPAVMSLAHQDAIDNLWKATKEATMFSMSKTRDSGLMDKRTFDYINSMFDYYVPLRGWDDTNADAVYEYTEGKRSPFNPTVKKMKGRESRAENPLAYIGNMAVSAVVAGNKNLVNQHLLRMVRNHPTSLMTVSEQWYQNIGTDTDPHWVERSPDITKDMTADEITAEIERFNQEMTALGPKATKDRNGLQVDYKMTNPQKMEHVVKVKEDGKEYLVYVNGSPKAAQALNGTNNNEKASFQSLAGFNRFISQALTSNNPAFVPANLMRDMLAAQSQIFIKEDPFYIAKFEANVFKLMRPRLGGKSGVRPTGYMPDLLRKWESNTLDENIEVERYFKEFMMNGGETGYVNMLAIEDFKKDIDKQLKKFNGHQGTISQGWQLFTDTVEFYNRAVEDATRFTTYLTSRQMGRSLEESINDAKTISINFNRKGTGHKLKSGNATVDKLLNVVPSMGALRNMIVFVNPAIQALQNQISLITKHPIRFSAVAAAYIARGMYQGAFNEMLNNLIGGGDGDDDEYYNIPDWVRRNNLIFRIPGTHTFVKIPLSQEFRIWHDLGETIGSVMRGKSNDSPVLEFLGAGLALLPVDPAGNDGNFVISAAPTAFQPVLQVVFNQNFLGYPIYKDNINDKYEPEFQKVTFGTPEYFVKASEGLNTLTGGDRHERGWLDKSTDKLGKYGHLLTNPAVWNHLLNGYLGGPYSFLNKTVDAIYSASANEDGVKTASIPIVSRFLARPIEKDDAGKLGQTYWDAKKEAAEVNSQVQHYKRDLKFRDDDEKAEQKLDEFLDSPEYEKARIVEQYSEAINKLRNMAREEGDPDEKREMLMEIDMLEQEMQEDLQEFKK